MPTSFMIKRSFSPATNKQVMVSQNFTVHFVWWVVLVLTNCAQLLLYILYEQSDLYMLVTTKALLVETTRAQAQVNSLKLG